MKQQKHNQSLSLADASTATDITLKSEQANADTAIKARKERAEVVTE